MGCRAICRSLRWERTPEYLVRDHDTVYGEIFTRRLRALGMGAAAHWKVGIAPGTDFRFGSRANSFCSPIRR
jgi:hypothetical protein